MLILPAPHRGIDQLAFSPDGSRLVAAGNGPGVIVWPMPGGTPAAVWVPAARPITALRFTPDGRSVLVEGGLFRGAYGIVQLDTASGRPTPGGFQQTLTGRLVGSAAGDRLVCAEWRTLYRVVELGPVGSGPAWEVSRGLSLLPRTAQPLGLLTSGQVAVSQYTLTPEEVTAFGHLLSRLIQVPDSGPCSLAPFRTDAVAVLRRNGLLAIWRPAARTLTRLADHVGCRPVAAAVHPDDRQLLVVGSDGLARLWHADSRVELAAFDFGLGRLRACAVAPDGLTAAFASATRVAVFDLP